jgi:hypothetical protein
MHVNIYTRHINIEKHKHKKEMDGCKSVEEATPAGVVPPTESADADLFLILASVCVFASMQIRRYTQRLFASFYYTLGSLFTRN